MVSSVRQSMERPSTKALAAAGHFRAIALWLNEPLVDQGIFVQVQAAGAGCLRVLAEYERSPDSEALTRFICHRIWHLNSPFIEGVHLLARPIGSTQTQWERRIRILTPVMRQRRAQAQAGSPLPPRITRRPCPKAAPLSGPKLQTLRTLMLTGSAVAAFVFGALVEVILSAGEPTLPLQPRQKASLTTPFAAEPVAPTATTVSYDRGPMTPRPHVVNAALEPVAVIEHDRVPQPHDPTVTLVFGGDITLQDLPYRQYQDDAQLLSGVSAYQQADVAMVSLDNTLAIAATSLEEEFIERQRPEAVNLLKAGGVDIINLTSEKTLDYGEQGLAETLETLDRSGIYRVGAGRNEREARRPEVLDVKGQRIAYLSYNQRDMRRAAGDVGGVNALDKQRLIEDIRAIRDEVDWLVVNFRWQEDVPDRAADWQTNLARLAVDQGADLVVGYHPHQLQGAEIYKGRAIAYSLGDFVFGDARAEQYSEASAVLKVSLRDRQMKVEMLPVKVENSQPQQVEGAAAEAILNKIRDASQTFETPMEPSVVLDARPAAPAPSATPGQNSDPNAPMVEFDTPFESQPFESQPFESQPLDAETVEPDPKLPSASPSDDFSDPGWSAPGDLNLEPIPDGLLDEWGPKTQPNEGTFTPVPEQPTAPTAPTAGPRPTPATSALPTVVDGSLEAEPSRSPATGAIGPYSEPLIGPLSAVPSPPAPDAVAEAKARLGLPETRVLKPLAEEAEETTQKLTAIAPADLLPASETGN
ncbi:MAG: CapA family protein [Leptolyngbyaceae cyanobacterium T60_A2020_046]|nr:CapA family protein [Leptolyngbyaceae cyanobacterium T60_A2020_046]